MYKDIKFTPKYVRIGRWMNGVLYLPEEHLQDTAILVIHSDADYLDFPAGRGLASHGYATLCANISRPVEELDKKLLEVKEAFEYLHALDFVKHIVLLGHSGGATLMSCYQAVAENGAKIFQDEHRIVKMSDVPSLSKADACLFIDSNWGNGAMTLFSIDPAIKDEKSGLDLNPVYDTFSSENGFVDGNTHYSEEFKKRFFKAQAKRNNYLIATALNRLNAINSHQGEYLDDEPFIIPGGAQIAPVNKLFPQDLSLFSHTKNEYDLVHADGSVSHGIIHSLRKPRGNKSMTPVFGLSTLVSTVKTYLTNSVVLATDEYEITETGVKGIDWDSSYCCTPGNIQYIKVPTLIMGMTGGYEFLASELLYEKSGSKDKSIAFIEGASHMLTTAKECERFPGEFKDTTVTLFNYVASWLEKHFKQSN